MTKKTKNEAGGGKDRFSEFRSPIIILGLLSAAVGGIYWLCRPFWDAYWLPVLFIAAGLAMPSLLSLWMSYGFQEGIVPGLAFILMGVFLWLFGDETEGLWKATVSNLFWTNVVILSLWFVFIAFLFRRRQNSGQVMQDYYRDETRRDYRWIIAPAILILLFLFDASWGQSMLAISSLKKSAIKTTPPDTFQIHAEYPSQILFDDLEPSEIHLQATGPLNCTNLVVSGEGLLFAMKPSSDDSIIEWHEQIVLHFDTKTNTSVLLVQPANPLHLDSRTIQIKLSAAGKELETADWLIQVEGSRSNQIREWKKNFLATGSTIVSLITAVFVGIKQLDEEKKRQRAERIKQAMATFDTDAKNDLSKMLQEHQDLCLDWNEWEKGLQEQFRKVYASFVEKKLWDALAVKTTTEIAGDVVLLLELCMVVFRNEQEKLPSTPEKHGPIQGNVFATENEKEKPVSTLKKLQKLQFALEKDGKALLSLVRDYPESITVAKRITRNYPKEIKDNILREFSKEYKEEIKKIGDALDFLPEEYSLLEGLFGHYSVINTSDGKLRAWLNLHRLHLSPFGDVNTPFTSLSENNESFLVNLTSTGFSFDIPPEKQVHFKFNDAWDVRTAVYGFCKTLPAAIASKTFLVLVPPFLMIDYEKETALNIVLHALGEQWLNTIADEPAAFYDLNIHQQKVLARLLCWHYGSLDSVLARLSREIDNKYPLISSENQQYQKERKKENSREFFKKAPNWLAGMPSTPVYAEEIPYLVDLRPSSTHRTFLLMPSVDLDFQSGISISPEKYDVFDTIVDRLNIHNYTFIHFYLDDRRWWRVEEKVLSRIINERIKQCVIQEDNPVDQINSLNDLFAQHEKEEAEKILAQKANGSPGRMVRLGQKLLMQHVERYPSSELLHIEDLIALR